MRGYIFIGDQTSNMLLMWVEDLHLFCPSWYHETGNGFSHI